MRESAGANGLSAILHFACAAEMEAVWHPPTNSILAFCDVVHIVLAVESATSALVRERQNIVVNR